MQKKIITILFTLVTIIYIIVGAFLFLNIQLMEAPEIIIKVEVTEINSEEAILQITIDIDNTNDFEIVTKNFELITSIPEDHIVTYVSIEGGEIGPNEKRTFIKNISVAFNGYSPELLTSKITGEVGAKTWFIQKTIPLNIGVITSIEDLINELAIPSINVLAEFVDITTEGINLSSAIEVYNPNTFEINIDNISTKIITEKGKRVGNVNVIGGNIPAKDYLKINTSGVILFESLNADMLLINISGIASAKIAGFEKKLPLNIQKKIMVPDFEELLLSKDKPTILSIMVDEKITLRGINFYVTMQVDNCYKVDLIIKDIVSRIYTVNDDKPFLIGENNKVEDIFARVGEPGFSECEILVPFYNLLPIRWDTNWLMVSVSGNVTIKGLDQSVFIEIRGFHDIRLLK